jgi:hypothetical protein
MNILMSYVCLHVVDISRGSKYPSIAQEIESFANVDRTQQKLNVRDLDSKTLYSVSAFIICL